VTGMGTTTFNTVLFNARGQQIELVESGGRPAGVVHTYVHGTKLVGPVPTCIGGGQPPGGCPFDEVTLLSNHLQTAPLSVGRGRNRRNYGTTPATCPKSHKWPGGITLTFADRSVDRLTGYQHCAGSTRAHAVFRPARVARQAG
jgi:hypothetical protein